jgi:hypothetical protein
MYVLSEGMYVHIIRSVLIDRVAKLVWYTWKNFSVFILLTFSHRWKKFSYYKIQEVYCTIHSVTIWNEYIWGFPDEINLYLNLWHITDLAYRMFSPYSIKWRTNDLASCQKCLKTARAQLYNGKNSVQRLLIEMQMKKTNKSFESVTFLRCFVL